MTDNVKHSTSYFHEVVAKAFEMFKNGYEPVMETPFQPRRQGSAFVVEYRLVREDMNFDELLEQSEALPSELLDRMTALRKKAEANREKESQLTIHKKWEIDDQINFEADEEKKLAESESCGRIVYTKEQLDAMHWDQLKPMLDKAGIRGRRRANMIRDFLKKQDEEK